MAPLPGARHLATLALIRGVISSVPRGKVITYGQVALAAGFPGAARLTVRALYGGVGLPWHRIVAAGGRIALTGEEGHEQRLRLRIEGVTFRGDRVRMDLHGWIPKARKSSSVRRAEPPGPRRGKTAPGKESRRLPSH
ncbi:MAG: MGMT family protein [Thermoplasmata archaeon]|nr:MGMT family protein [Thermoplasmata archaeon]